MVVCKSFLGVSGLGLVEVVGVTGFESWFESWFLGTWFLGIWFSGS